MTVYKALPSAAQNYSIEMATNIQNTLQARNAYYGILNDYINQLNDMDASRVMLKINITVSAIQFSSGDLGKLKISMPQFNQMIVNKHVQYDNLNSVREEVNALVTLTKLGFEVTKQKLAEAIVVSECSYCS